MKIIGGTLQQKIETGDLFCLLVSFTWYPRNRIEMFWIPRFGCLDLQWGSKELFIIYFYFALVLLCHRPSLSAQSQLVKGELRGHSAVAVNELVTLLHLWDCICACGSDMLLHWFQSSQVFHFWLLIRHLLLIFWANTPSPSPENRIQRVCGGHCRGLKALLLAVKEQWYVMPHIFHSVMDR